MSGLKRLSAGGMARRLAERSLSSDHLQQLASTPAVAAALSDDLLDDTLVKEAAELATRMKKFHEDMGRQTAKFLHVSFPKKALGLTVPENPVFKDGVYTAEEISTLRVSASPTEAISQAGSAAPSEETADADTGSLSRPAKRARTADAAESSISATRSSSSSASPSAGSVSLPKSTSTVPTNATVTAFLGQVKPEIYELLDVLGAVRIWIQLNTPSFADGNNFGVEVQQEIVAEITRCEDNAFNILDTVAKYYFSRAKLASKVLKYPGVEDYARAILELDEKQYLDLRLCMMDLRNTYAFLHDLMTKNLEKVKQPRPQQQNHHMY